VADKNLTIGLCLVVFGVLFGTTSYFVLGNVPLTALGMGLAVLGAAWAMIPSNPLPRETAASLIKSSCNNIEAILEASGAVERAVYIPLRPQKRVVAYVPLKRAGQVTLSEIAENAGKAVFKRGGSLGVIVVPPRVEISNPHSTGELNIDVLLEQALVESEVVSSARVLRAGDLVEVEVRGLKVDIDHPRFRAVMGSLPACIVAQVVALALSKPVRVADEEQRNDRLIVRLRALDWTDKAYI
jgi:hypothetical protein